MTVARTILDAIVPLLAELGFEKRTGEIFTIDLAPAVLGWLGLNRATKHRAPGEAEVNPVVGVRFQDVERVVAECRGEKFHAYSPATVSSPLGYVLPDARYRAWVFGPERAKENAADMVSMVAAYGIPFMRSVAGLPELIQRIEARTGFDHQLVYRRPVAYLVAGDGQRAGRVLAEAVDVLGTRTDAAAVEFRRFAEVLRGRLPAL